MFARYGAPSLPAGSSTDKAAFRSGLHHFDIIVGLLHRAPSPELWLEEDESALLESYHEEIRSSERTQRQSPSVYGVFQ